MNRIVTIILMSILIAAPGARGADDRGAPSLREKRVELLSTLKSELLKASARATLDEKQDKQLQEAQKKLTEAQVALRKGGMLNPFKMLKMKGALADIEEIARGGAFRTEDRQRIQEVIKRIKETRQSKGHE